MRPSIRSRPLIHSTAIVHQKARLGDGVHIGPYSVIDQDVSIGKGTKIGSNVTITGKTEIGEDCRFFPFCCIGTDPQDLSFGGEVTSVKIGNDNIFREFVTVHRGTEKGRNKTEIGNGNYFMAYAHVAHDCLVGNQTVLTNGATLGGHVSVDDFVFISAYAAVHQFGRVGKYALIGGISTITQDVLPFSRVAGGRPTLLYGLNTIGLRRRGFARERIKVLKDIFKIFFYSNLNTSQALKRIEEKIPSGEDRDEIIRFIQSSERGIVKKAAEKWAAGSE
jgi:UDP-N-acetylglucosamine acyltransferase